MCDNIETASSTATTGHLVLSTLHTTDLAGAIARLRALELDDDAISNLMPATNSKARSPVTKKGYLFTMASGERRRVSSKLVTPGLGEGNALVLAPQLKTQQSEYREQALPLLEGLKLIDKSESDYRAALRGGRVATKRWAATRDSPGWMVVLLLLLFN